MLNYIEICVFVVRDVLQFRTNIRMFALVVCSNLQLFHSHIQLARMPNIISNSTAIIKIALN